LGKGFEALPGGRLGGMDGAKDREGLELRDQW
jgi:hypothetical protein